MEKPRGIRKTRVGMVVSDKMDKTVVVEVKRLVAHPLYHKIIRRRVKIKAHDPAEHLHRWGQGPAGRDPAHQQRQALAGQADPGEGPISGQCLKDIRP